MSSPAKAKRYILGERNPASTLRRGEFWMKCDLALSPNCEGERWVGMHGAMSQVKMKAAGWVKRCGPCANRAMGDMKTYKKPVDMLCGSTAYPENRRNGGKEMLVRCAICDPKKCGPGYYKRMDLKDALNTSGVRRLGLCEDCKPWALLALKQEIYKGPSPERDRVYSKIKRLLKDWDAKGTASGPNMPFWALAKSFDSARFADKPKTRQSMLCNLRLMVLYFDETPINQINSEKIYEFKDYLQQEVVRSVGRTHLKFLK